MHTLLRWADLSVCGSEAGVLAQADGLVKRGFLTPTQRALIVPGAVAAFARSPLGQRALRAGRVEREYEFGVLEDASTLIPGGPAGEEILLNGAIDLLLFEEDGLTVVDFKPIESKGAPAKAGLLRGVLGVVPHGRNRREAVKQAAGLRRGFAPARPFRAAPPVRRRAQEAPVWGDRSRSNRKGPPQKQGF